MLHYLLTQMLAGRRVRFVHFERTESARGHIIVSFEDGWELVVHTSGDETASLGVSSGLRQTGERVRQVSEQESTLELLMESGESLLLTASRYAYHAKGVEFRRSPKK